MAKVKVPIYGSPLRSVNFDPEAGTRAEAAVAALRAQISAGVGGTIYHKNLLGLQVGDDHPQYTMWQAQETIQATWNFAAEPDIEGIPLTEFIEDVVGNELVQDSTSISWTYGDTANTLQAHIIDEYVQDLMSTTLVDSSSIDFTYNDLAGTISAATINANPTAQIGLTAVNGTAATPMRSDGAPALDQGIAPTWTSSHTWTDNDEVRLGTGNDLRLFHDGTDSWIRNDTGILKLSQGANVTLQFNSSRAWGVDGANYGSSGQVLTSNGSSAAPSWSSASGGGGTYKVQVNNLSITSNNVLQDTDLVIALTAGTWLVTLDVMQTQNSTPQMETQVQYTGTVTSVAGIATRMRSTTAFSVATFTALPYSQTETTSDTVGRRISFRLTVSDAGNVKVQARQVNSSGTAVTFLAGSNMHAVQIS